MEGAFTVFVVAISLRQNRSKESNEVLSSLKACQHKVNNQGEV